MAPISILYKYGSNYKRPNFFLLVIRSLEHHKLYRKPSRKKPQKTTKIMASPENCITCNQVVTTRQEAIQCDGCGLWNHRICNTGKLKFPLLLVYEMAFS